MQALNPTQLFVIAEMIALSRCKSTHLTRGISFNRGLILPANRPFGLRLHGSAVGFVDLTQS
jgi:hypothetical protein